MGRAATEGAPVASFFQSEAGFFVELCGASCRELDFGNSRNRKRVFREQPNRPGQVARGELRKIAQSRVPKTLGSQVMLEVPVIEGQREDLVPRRVPLQIREQPVVNDQLEEHSALLVLALHPRYPGAALYRDLERFYLGSDFGTSRCAGQTWSGRQS